jgi:two-component system, OmpR family, phosphate regulon sensor histidine kinase PhoR
MEGLLAELNALTDMVNAGTPGLTAVQRMVEFTQAAAGAQGASFVEYSSAGGRVIAGSGVSVWALGRQVDPAHPMIVRLMSADRLIEVGLDEMPVELAEHLNDAGVHHMLAAKIELSLRVVGTLHAYFSGDGPATSLQRNALSLSASLLGHLYLDGQGLPVYGGEPVTALPADAIAVVNADGTVRSWNDAAAAVTGRPAATPLGRPLPVRVPTHGQVLDQRLPDGRWLQVLATDLPDTGDRLVTLRDVTQAHRREQARDLFVTVTSHELRTPVTVIKGYADTLAERWDSLTDQARREAVFVVGQRAGELARLVDRLLTAASDVAGLRDSSARVPFEPAGALREAAAELSADLRRNLRVTLPEELPKVRGDRASLATVVTELVTNACKYSPERVDVELTAGSDARTVWFRVGDRGLGIRPEHAERAFERFWQLDRGDQRRYGGVGLGLYLVRRIVERQNGWVSLRPRDGGGTVAEVRLPRVDAGEAD